MQQQLFIYSARRIFENSIKANLPEASNTPDEPVESDYAVHGACDPVLPEERLLSPGVPDGPHEIETHQNACTLQRSHKNRPELPAGKRGD
jgi:hypothetical protein